MNNTPAFGRTAGSASSGNLRRGANFGGRTYGDSTGYNSMQKMQFRGQERQSQAGLIGGNPNVDETDDYIVNLQQQIHFMELELKILRDKVIEDSQKSGIGSLYDDDKTSHQHISLLKSKYSQMKRDHDKMLQDLNKQNLKVKGQEFVLDAQIKIMSEQKSKLKQSEESFTDDMRQQTGELSTVNRDSNRQLINLESDLRTLINDGDRAESTHFEHKIHQDKEKTFDEENKARHDKEVGLITDLIDRKQKEHDEIKQALLKIEADFKGKTDYQNHLAESAQLRDQIEACKVKVQYLDIQVQILTDETQFLTDKKEDLIEESKLADCKNEELKTQFRAQEEIASKRLQQKLNREKSVEVKELLANDEIIKATNEDIRHKLLSERENYDTLLESRMVTEEHLLRTKAQLEIDTAVVDDQEKVLAELKKEIEAELDEFNALEETVAEAKIVKRVEGEKNRRVQQQYTSLAAKREFIETNYDYTSAPNDMNLEIFRNIMRSNEEVNETVQGFCGKVNTVKKEVTKILATRDTW